MLKLKNDLAQGLSLKDADGSWAWLQQQLLGAQWRKHGSACSGTLGEAQSCWRGTNVSTATAAQVV